MDSVFPRAAGMGSRTDYVPDLLRGLVYFDFRVKRTFALPSRRGPLAALPCAVFRASSRASFFKVVASRCWVAKQCSLQQHLDFEPAHHIIQHNFPHLPPDRKRK